MHPCPQSLTSATRCHMLTHYDPCWRAARRALGCICYTPELSGSSSCRRPPAGSVSLILRRGCRSNLTASHLWRHVQAQPCVRQAPGLDHDPQPVSGSTNDSMSPAPIHQHHGRGRRGRAAQRASIEGSQSFSICWKDLRGAPPWRPATWVRSKGEAATWRTPCQKHSPRRP